MSPTTLRSSLSRVSAPDACEGMGYGTQIDARSSPMSDTTTTSTFRWTSSLVRGSALALGGLLFAACGGETTESPRNPPPDAAERDATSAEAKGKPEVAPKTASNDGVWTLPEGANPALTNPNLAKAEAPEQFDVKFTTTEGPFVVRFHRDWSPNGADRVYNLVSIGYYDQIAFFRAIEGFMVQFGISGYPEVNETWREANIPDDPVKKSNTRGMVTFAKSGAPDSRSTQLFINYVDTNAKLDAMGFSPVGEVIEGMDTVDMLYKGYGEGAPRGRGPNQMLIQSKGNTYLKDKFPELDYIEKAEFVGG